MKKGLWSIYSIIIVSMALLAGCGQGTGGSAAAVGADKPKEKITVNIGIQQSIWPILLAKEKGWFEEAYAKVGAEVKWVEFQSGAPYFEAIASDRLDFGRVGNAPVIVGQAAGVPFKEIAVGSVGKKGDAILVQKNSPIRTLQDLRGKKIAVAKGSSGYNLLYQALQQAGLKPTDVEIIQLQPDEAQPAFETGGVDAWSVWEPYVSTQTIKNGAVVLANGETLNSLNAGFHVVRTKFAEEHPELVEIYLKVNEQALRWQKEHPDDAVEVYAKAKKLDPAIIRAVIANTEPANLPITPEVIESQQKTADFLYQLGGIKKQIDVSQVVDNQYIEKILKE
ncbi:aliphatic sulfonate ABC transporter substrate-binding protein [Brevibacillus sp. SYP-B805]|uniref:aliphatic sulfonate ABC transporter substrate-binding protein n=1 Tax=Brevibacillus sp. SYP-B805 TaxID=1578199 RepID=UPI0013ED13E1|nr:aliphatic sulfonate ABC transporter substrate-binding protein [Brevibacillus sp. SYP-B805]NGQ96745.1 aliphatic sulfonate ABC transporter substrate-binding protein [Brevibacillus sp. SYP-B805]